MRDDEFEWDDAKAAENFAKHRVRFDTARKAIHDPHAVEAIDDRNNYEEDRFIVIGFAEGAVLHVVYTQRAGRTRLISARRATRRESDDYFQQGK